MTAPLTIGVDATFLQRDQRSTGRMLRSILNEWKKSFPHKLVLLAKGKRHLAEIAESPYGKWDVMLGGTCTDLDVSWFPWGQIDWEIRCPAVVTVHDITCFLEDYPQTRHSQEACSALQSVSNLATRIITHSSFLRTDIHRHLNYDISRVDVVPLGFDAVFHPHRNQYLDPFFAEKIGETPYILFVGTPDPVKNLEGLLEAFLLLEGQIKSRLLLVSPKPPSPTWAQRLQGKSSNLVCYTQRLEDKIIWLPGVDDATLAELYRRSQIFVIPSLYEGFGLPLLEAMACGTATAAARTSSLPEVGADIPYWFNPNDPVDIARALLEAIENPNGSEGPARAALFSWEKCATTISNILTETAGKKIGR